jgi:hypothetical protein
VIEVEAAVVGYFLTTAVLAGTTIWVGIDNQSLLRRDPGGRPTWLWVAYCLLLWIVGFPWYVVHRHRVRSRVRLEPPAATAGWPAPQIDRGPPAGSTSLGTMWPQHTSTQAPWPDDAPSVSSVPPRPEVRRRGFAWWSILMVVVGGLLLGVAVLGSFITNPHATPHDGIVQCGTFWSPADHNNVVGTDGQTCSQFRGGLLVGDIIAFVVGVLLVAGALVARRRRVTVQKPVPAQTQGSWTVF